MSIENFIDALASGNMPGAEDAFNSEMEDRLSIAMDAKRAEVGQSLYSTAEVEDDEV